MELGKKGPEHKNATTGNAGVHKQIPSQEIITANALVIDKEIQWLGGILEARIARLEGKENDFYFSGSEPPALSGTASPYAQLVQEHQLPAPERLLLICSLVPHISPETFTNKLRDEDVNLKIKFPKLGGYFDATFTNFVPTLQTVLYLLGGEDISTMLYYHLFFSSKSVLVREQIVTMRNVSTSEDETNLRNHAVALAPEFVDYLISGRRPRPDFGRGFPASLISTNLDWDHLVVPASTLKELKRVSRWEQFGGKLLERSGYKINSSFTCLFYGPSGSGKTLAVQLLGKSLGIDVFRIDLSMIVSKYIGETEKNLAYLFDRAKNKNWILFFDEADSLFGKRTDIKDSKDKWANLEMSYLLQRMEEHTGLTVLATNLKNNIDPAMSRRFQSVIYFNKPDKEQRLQLWQKLMPAPYVYHPDINFDRLSRFELTGGNIGNILKAACLEAEAREALEVDGQDLADAIKREFSKENRSPN